MWIGGMRHRLKIEKKTVTQDTLGDRVESWETVATVWARIEDLRGREFFEAERVASEVTTRIRIRYRGDIDTTMRCLWEDKVYDIQAVLDGDGRQRISELMCREVV